MLKHLLSECYNDNSICFPMKKTNASLKSSELIIILNFFYFFYTRFSNKKS